MATKTTSQKNVEIEIRPKDIARALDAIAEWIRGVRSTILLMDPNIVIRVKRPAPNQVIPPPMLDGCPPPDPCADPDKPPTYHPRPRQRPRRPRPPRPTK
jgi:hypothetical protein